MENGKLVIFTVNHEEYGLPIEEVQEIIRLGDVRPIPEESGFVEGLISLRGKAIPLISLQTRFGAQPESDSTASKKCSYALIVEFGGDTVALSVDEVREVRSEEDDVVEPPPLVKAQFVSGIINVADRIIMKLDLARMLDNTGLEEIDV